MPLLFPFYSNVCPLFCFPRPRMCLRDGFSEKMRKKLRPAQEILLCRAQLACLLSLFFFFSSTVFHPALRTIFSDFPFKIPIRGLVPSESYPETPPAVRGPALRRLLRIRRGGRSPARVRLTKPPPPAPWCRRAWDGGLPHPASPPPRSCPPSSPAPDGRIAVPEPDCGR